MPDARCPMPDAHMIPKEFKKNKLEEVNPWLEIARISKLQVNQSRVLH